MWPRSTALSVPERVVQRGSSTFSEKDVELICLLSEHDIDNDIVAARLHSVLAEQSVEAGTLVVQGDSSSGWEVRGGTVMADVNEGELVLRYR